MGAWGKRTLGQVLEEVSQRYPENAALIFKDQRISYGELLEKARALAKGLIALGVGRGDKVSIWAGNCPEWVYTQMATAFIGAVLVPVNTRFRTSELEYILGQSESTTLVMMDRFLNIDNLGMVKEIAPEMDGQVAGQLRLKPLPLLKNVILLGERKMPGTFSYFEVISLGQKISEQELASIAERVKPDDVIMFQYTSGTTSFPKGVMLSHDGVTRYPTTSPISLEISNNCPGPTRDKNGIKWDKNSFPRFQVSQRLRPFV